MSDEVVIAKSDILASVTRRVLAVSRKDPHRGPIASTPDARLVIEGGPTVYLWRWDGTPFGDKEGEQTIDVRHPQVELVDFHRFASSKSTSAWQG